MKITLNIPTPVDGGVYDCALQGGPVIPPVTPPTGGGGPYTASGLWLSPGRLSTGTLTQANPGVDGPFTVPSSFPTTGTVEFAVSGANINIRLDGVLIAGDARYIPPGPHVLRAEITSGAVSASGSVDLHHSP